MRKGGRIQLRLDALKAVDRGQVQPFARLSVSSEQCKISSTKTGNQLPTRDRTAARYTRAAGTSAIFQRAPKTAKCRILRNHAP